VGGGREEPIAGRLDKMLRVMRFEQQKGK